MLCGVPQAIDDFIDDASLPIMGVSKKQDCVSHSTPEAELVAAAWALRREGLPSLDLWKTLLGRDQGLRFLEDNQAMIRVCQTGRNPTMRHLNRTHGVCISWLKEVFDAPGRELVYIKSEKQAADNADKWWNVCTLINVTDLDVTDLETFNAQ